MKIRGEGRSSGVTRLIVSTLCACVLLHVLPPLGVTVGVKRRVCRFILGSDWVTQCCTARAFLMYCVDHYYAGLRSVSQLESNRLQHNVD